MNSDFFHDALAEQNVLAILEEEKEVHRYSQIHLCIAETIESITNATTRHSLRILLQSILVR